jgi:hypothetical protein
MPPFSRDVDVANGYGGPFCLVHNPSIADPVSEFGASSSDILLLDCQSYNLSNSFPCG